MTDYDGNGYDNLAISRDNLNLLNALSYVNNQEDLNATLARALELLRAADVPRTRPAKQTGGRRVSATGKQKHEHRHASQPT
jgi:hypothetical protein